MQYVRLTKNHFIEQLSKSSGEACLLNVDSLNDALNFLSIPNPSAEFVNCQANLKQIQTQIQRDIIICMRENAIIYPWFKLPRKFADKDPIKLLLNSPDEPELNGSFGQFKVIMNPAFIPTIYHCNVLDKCNYSTDRYHNYKRHIDLCATINVQKINTIQKMYGEDDYVIGKLVSDGYLPSEALSFRKTYVVAYDIEAYEKLEPSTSTGNLTTIALHKLLSIGVGNNRGQEECFVRSDSSHEAAGAIVKSFVDTLEDHLENHELSIPTYFTECITNLEAHCEDGEISKKKRMKLQSLANKIKKYIKMDVWGFNSGKLQIKI